MGQLRRLFVTYITALAVLLASVVITNGVTEYTSVQLERDASNINVSGRQRMLIQRISYLAQELSLQTRAGSNAAGNETTVELMRMIDLFEVSHNRLMSMPGISAFYLSDDGHVPLDERIRQFIELARSVAADPTGTEHLTRLKQLEAEGLLRGLDAVVASIEAVSVARVSQLQTAGRTSIALALIIILVEITFIFVPGHRLIERTLNSLSKRNREIDQKRTLLTARNGELTRSIETVLLEQDRMRRALSESEALRKEQVAFTYAVSHDLKSPANTLRLLLDELEYHCSDTFDEFSRELVERGRHTLVRMGDHVENILFYAQATEARSDPEPVVLAEVVMDVRTSLAGDITNAGARLFVGHLPAISGYRDQLFSLLLNLVSNALKYQRPGVTPLVWNTGVPLPGKNGITLEVRDNGIGVAEENHDKIFELFQRLHLRSEYPGTGLGLSTCRRIAVNHGGSIDIDSAFGRGSVFRVKLYVIHGQPRSVRDAA